MKLTLNKKEYNVEINYVRECDRFYVSTEEYTGVGVTIEHAVRNLSEQLEHVSDDSII